MSNHFAAEILHATAIAIVTVEKRPAVLPTQRPATKNAFPTEADDDPTAALPWLRESTTLATTPLPKMTRMAVPISSARKALMVLL